jgi:PLP dependent protein
MAVNTDFFHHINQFCQQQQVALVAVSKTKPAADIQEMYDLGQRVFGENYVQELVDKVASLPKDIEWHFIGHLQSNKVKYIAPFVHLIHGVDSWKLLETINKEGQKNQRIISCLLQMHIATEESKFGFDAAELKQAIQQLSTTPLPFVRICGLMGMASFSNDKALVQQEFRTLKKAFDDCQSTNIDTATFKILSMGMSGDYEMAIEEGSNMIRIGSLLFGNRSKG